LDTSALPSTLIFIIFLLLFTYLSLAEHSGAVLGAFVGEGRVSNPARLLRSLKYAAVIATTLSGLALVYSIGPPSWLTIAFLSLALLLSLVIIDRASAAFATRYPARVTRWGLPLRRVVQRYSSHRPAITNGGLTDNGRGGEPPGGNYLERDEVGITEEELVGLDERDREMLRSILELDVTAAHEIMVPRLDIVAVELNSSLSEVAEKVVRYGYSRLPVYEDTIDQIVGIVHTRDLIAALAQQKAATSLRDLVRPAFFIPETKRLDDLLQEMRVKGVQMAIVVDEYGGTEGLVTMEDLLEEIVGEIEDEFSRTREPEVVLLTDGAVMVDAGVPIEHVAELFSSQIDDQDDVDTVGGYVYQRLGKIPQVGDVVVTDHLRIEVASILGRRLRKLRISRANATTAD